MVFWLNSACKLLISILLLYFSWSLHIYKSLSSPESLRKISIPSPLYIPHVCLPSPIRHLKKKKIKTGLSKQIASPVCQALFPSVSQNKIETLQLIKQAIMQKSATFYITTYPQIKSAFFLYSSKSSVIHSWFIKSIILWNQDIEAHSYYNYYY